MPIGGQCPPAGSAPRQGASAAASSRPVLPRAPVRAKLRRRSGAVLLAAAMLLPAAGRGERVEIGGAEGVALSAHWLPAGAERPRPAVIALHGCGGLYRRDGVTLEARYTDYAERLHASGIHVLLPDSFGSRGSGPICTVRLGERTIDAATRRADVMAALQWLRQRPDVDARRLVLLGWSHGATTLLGALNSLRPGHADVAGAIAFYPGCGNVLKQPFAVAAPLLMLLAADDDWTPPAACERLVDRTRQGQPGVDIALTIYPDSMHGFDSRRPVRFRADVPNGANRAGVHVGGNPVARAAALAEMDRFLARILH
jgi:dienelactone hydrolase